MVTIWDYTERQKHRLIGMRHLSIISGIPVPKLRYRLSKNRQWCIKQDRQLYTSIKNAKSLVWMLRDYWNLTENELLEKLNNY